VKLSVPYSSTARNRLLLHLDVFMCQDKLIDPYHKVLEMMGTRRRLELLDTLAAIFVNIFAIFVIV